MARREGETRIVIDPGLLDELFAPAAAPGKSEDAGVTADAAPPAADQTAQPSAVSPDDTPADTPILSDAGSPAAEVPPSAGPERALSLAPEHVEECTGPSEPLPEQELVTAEAAAPSGHDAPADTDGLEADAIADPAPEDEADSEQAVTPVSDDAQPSAEVAIGQPVAEDAAEERPTPADDASAEHSADETPSGSPDEETASPVAEPSSDDIIRQRHEAAEAALRAGQLDEATERFTELSVTHPACWSAHFNLGLAQEKAARQDKAAAAFAAAIAADPSRWEAHYALGICQLRSDRPDEALRAFDRAIACQPMAAEAKIARALALQVLGRIPEAREQYAAVCAQGAATPEALANLTRICLVHGDTQEACAWASQLLEAAPGSALLQLTMAELSLRQNDLEGAAEYLREVARHGEAAYEHWFNLGCVLADSGRLEAAAAAYRKATSLDPARPEAHGNLGVVLHALYHLPAAQESYEQALGLRPDHPGLLWNLAAVAAERGDLDVAQESLESLVAVRPKWAPARERLAKLR